MKKIFTLFVLVFAVMAAYAGNTKTFTDKLVVSVNGESMTQQATVNVTYVDDTHINFSLKNFALESDGDIMPVGNIDVNNLELTSTKYYDSFSYDGDLLITEGNLEGVDQWIGPMLGEIPLKLNGKINDEKVYVEIDIDMMSSLGQIINVKFGEDNLNMKSFTDQLVVSVNGESMTQEATVYVTFVDDTHINFSLKNFALDSDGDIMPVGNIEVNNLVLTPADGYSTFTFDGDLLITEGDMEGVDMWIGPMLDEIPLKLNGKINDDKVYVEIDIDMMSSLGQIINVKFGTDEFQPHVNTYTVTFTVDGEVISSETYEEGSTIVVPTVEDREGYTFAWDTTIPETVTGDITINGSYTANTYKVTYIAEGKTIREDSVKFGEALPAAPEYTPESDDRYSREFTGWDGETYATMPAHDVTYTAIITVLDGISNILGNTDATIFDLQGCRVNRAANGIFIINGQKIIR